MVLRILAAFFIFFMAFASNDALASGKLTLQNNLQHDGTKYRPMIGFGVYEPLTKFAHVNAWTGYGKQFVEEHLSDVNWWVTKAQLDLHLINKVTIAPGIQYRYIDDKDETLLPEQRKDTTVFVRLDYQLW